MEQPPNSSGGLEECFCLGALRTLNFAATVTVATGCANAKMNPGAASAAECTITTHQPSVFTLSAPCHFSPHGES